LFWSYVQGTLAAWDPGYGISIDTNVKCVPPAENYLVGSKPLRC
jgi:hypothetical protein